MFHDGNISQCVARLFQRMKDLKDINREKRKKERKKEKTDRERERESGR